ncbi:hypothetical protein DA803_00285 [[Mycoplasma] phocae]|uniref:Uncharacterized protein n=1 Tax=[Mycoplasma] phocae TaxID=142651 RepID=A0A2Z5IPK4_9BACT|nr:hypothetical protein [[Mycoplasma] phocae]AXE60540.1 hypothetical protein DA803_00285 [[Mycoplasma] phocae]
MKFEKTMCKKIVDKKNPYYSAALVFGLLLLLTNACILCYYFYSYGIQPLLKKYSNPEIRDIVLKNGIFPDALAAMWKQAGSFTMLSNFILSFAFIVFALHHKSQRVQYFFFFAVVNISITFLIYWTLIFFTILKRGGWNNLGSAIPSFILHAINPAIGMIFLIIGRKEIRLKTSDLWLSNIMGLVYFFFALITFFMGSQLLPDKNNSEAYIQYNIVVYKFLNFIQPFFYTGRNLGIIITLDVLLFVLGASLPIAIAWFWKGVLRIKKAEAIVKFKHYD